MGKPSNKFSFTKKALGELVPESKRKSYYDENLKGLMLDVLPSGTKVFRVYKRVKGKSSPVKVTLGYFPDLSIENARKKALVALGEIAHGVNPNEKRDSDKKSKITLIEAYKSYMDSKSLSSVTVRGYDQCINTYMPEWHDIALLDISDEHIKSKHKEISTLSLAQADYCMRVIRAVFNYAMYTYKTMDGEYLITKNPVDVLKQQRIWNKIGRKQSRLTKSELFKLQAGIEKIRDEPTSDTFLLTVCDFVEFALFTGLRKTNLLQLEWSRVNLEDRFFYISETKNGEPLELPIGDHLLTILERRRDVTSNNYVFQADNEHGYIREPRKCIEKICEVSGIEFGLHDLRRTFTSIAELLKVGTYALKRLLNHKTARNDVTGGYTILTAEELRGPSEEIQNSLLLAMGLPLYGQSIDVRLHNLINSLSHTDKSKALEVLQMEFSKSTEHEAVKEL
ncbi:site-specific integrase [Vibrio parahaemolyticus]|nr:site-specific integrase [Vibrio parahaemolyticus]ELI5422540.1 site-specific integrase [Vibrio parahaemolyticus]